MTFYDEKLTIKSGPLYIQFEIDKDIQYAPFFEFFGSPDFPSIANNFTFNFDI